MSRASNLERQMLDLINEERVSRGLNPVELELRLNDSSEDHSQWMLEEDRFSHTGENGSSAGDRMRDADFDFDGNWRWGENIAYQSERGAPGLADDVEDLHNSLMNSPGHRANILNPDYEVVGLGIETGDFNGFDVVMVTQNFADTDAELLLDLPDGTPDVPQIENPEPEPEPAPDFVAETPEAEEETPDPELPNPEVTDTEEPPEPIAEASDPEIDTPTPEPDMPEVEPDTPEVIAKEPEAPGQPNPLAQVQLFFAGFLTRLEDEFTFNFDNNRDGNVRTFQIDFDNIFDDFFDTSETETEITQDTPGDQDGFAEVVEFQFIDQWDCFA